MKKFLNHEFYYQLNKTLGGLVCGLISKSNEVIDELTFKDSDKKGN